MDVASSKSAYLFTEASGILGETLGNLIGINLVGDVLTTLFATVSSLGSGAIFDEIKNLFDGLGELTGDNASFLSLLEESYGTNITTRGTGYSLVTGLNNSYSQVANITSGTSDIAYYQDLETTSHSSVDETSTTTSYTVSTLGEMLFAETTAIGVKVKAWDDEALDALVAKMSYMNDHTTVNDSYTSVLSKVAAMV